MPVKIREWFTVKGRDQLSSESDIDVKEVLPGVWAPIRSSKRSYYKGTEKNPLIGKLAGTAVIRVIEDKSKFNVDLDPKLFEYKIPLGTQVVDHNRNITYTEGSTDPDAYLAHLAKTATEGVADLTVEENRRPALIFVPESFWWRNGPYFTWGTALSFATIAMLLFVRRRWVREA